LNPTLLVLASTAATAAVLAWRWRALIRTWSWSEWLAAGVLLAAVVTLWQVVVAAVLGAPAINWVGARLAPTFGLVYGYRLYYPATEGPILNHVVGPASALAFLPTTIFRTPTPAILAGAALEVVYVCGPLLLFVWRAGGRTPAEQPLALACGVGACLLMTRYPGSYYWLSILHADGPALGFGMLACAALVSADGTPPTTRALVASAMAAVLAPWAKQTEAPLPIALVLAVWLMHGRALAVRYALIVAVVGVLVSAVFLAWFGRPMIFNMVEILSHHGWYKPGVAGLAATFWSLLWNVRGILALFATAAVASVLVAGERSRWTAGAWIPPVLVALFLLPTSTLSANKIGGEPYALHSASYLLAATAVLLVELARRAAPARALAWAFCAVALLAAWQSGKAATWNLRASPWENDNQQAYEFARRHPGEAYFPWQPLASLLAEGQLYHFEYGMMDRFIAGYEPTPEHVRAHLPPRLRWIAARTRVWTFRYFPEYSATVNLEELPGWIVLTRPES
jgi:hypothetical protein